MQIMIKTARLLCGLFFAVTCFFGFIALMIFNLWIFDELFPGIVNAVDHLEGGARRRSLIVLVIACPIPLVVCFAWYKLFDFVDKKLASRIVKLENS